MYNLSNVLYGILIFVRYAGIIVLTIIGLGMLISEGAKSKLSPAKIFTVTASAIVAAVLFWELPNLVTYARQDSRTIVPEHPIGQYP